MRAMPAAAFAVTVLLLPVPAHAACDTAAACRAGAAPPASAASSPTVPDMRGAADQAPAGQGAAEQVPEAPGAALDAEALRLVHQAAAWFGRPLRPADARALVHSLHAGGRLTGIDGLTALAAFADRVERHAAALWTAPAEALVVAEARSGAAPR